MSIYSFLLLLSFSVSFTACTSSSFNKIEVIDTSFNDLQKESLNASLKSRISHYYSLKSSCNINDIKTLYNSIEIPHLRYLYSFEEYKKRVACGIKVDSVKLQRLSIDEENSHRYKLEIDLYQSGEKVGVEKSTWIKVGDDYFHRPTHMLLFKKLD